MNIPEFIAKKIESAFEECIEKLADELAAEHGEDMPTGALAFEMMSAEIFLQEKWREYCKQKADQQSVHLTAFGAGERGQNPLQSSFIADDPSAKHGGR